MYSQPPAKRPEDISAIINGLERYNPSAIEVLEGYLAQQCAEKFCDAENNLALLKLWGFFSCYCLVSSCFLPKHERFHTLPLPLSLPLLPSLSPAHLLTDVPFCPKIRFQLNPDRLSNETVTNVLVKAMTQFPSAHFPLALHLIPPVAMAPGTELHEAVAKLRSLSARLEGAQYAHFWAALDGDDLCADLVADVAGFEDLVRARIAALLAQAYRELPLPLLSSWLGLDKTPDAAATYVVDHHDWTVDAAAGVAWPPPNPDNEARKDEVREDVSVDMFARVIRRSWEEAAAA